MSAAERLRFDPHDIRGLARLITRVESLQPETFPLMAQVYAAVRGGFRLGVTGPPGAGKSTLVDQLIRQLRDQQRRVAVVAIDPSSPFTGGAVLGDRVRMQAHAGDEGVFIRSVGSRGARGGLSRATRAITQLYDAYAFDWIIIETVGVGQSEFDIMELADTTVVVLVPEAGDTVQTLKAGLLEVADLLVVNKGDRAGAAQMMGALASMVQLEQAIKATDGLGPRGPHGAPLLNAAMAGDHDEAHREISTTFVATPATDRWVTPVLMTTATRGEGVTVLLDAIARHRAWETTHHAAASRRAKIRRQDVVDLCAVTLLARWQARLAQSPDWQARVADVSEGRANPYEVVAALVREFEGGA